MQNNLSNSPLNIYAKDSEDLQIVSNVNISIEPLPSIREVRN